MDLTTSADVFAHLPANNRVCHAFAKCALSRSIGRDIEQYCRRNGLKMQKICFFHQKKLFFRHNLLTNQFECCILLYITSRSDRSTIFSASIGGIGGAFRVHLRFPRMPPQAFLSGMFQRRKSHPSIRHFLRMDSFLSGKRRTRPPFSRFGDRCDAHMKNPQAFHPQLLTIHSSLFAAFPHSPPPSLLHTMAETGIRRAVWVRHIRKKRQARASAAVC